MAKRVYEAFARGVYREPPSPTFRLRREVPADVRQRIGKREWDVSLRTDSPTEARARALDQRSKWEHEVVAARQGVCRPTLDVTEAGEKLRYWSFVVGWWEAHLEKPDVDPRPPGADSPGGIAPEVITPAAPALMIARLERATAAPGEWRQVEGFDAAMQGALTFVGILATPEVGGWEELRPIFAERWRDALLTREQHRLRKVADDLSAASVVATQGRYTARAEDKTVADLVATYKAERASKPGQEKSSHRYAHIYKALEEVLGPTTPLRSIKRADCRTLRDTLKRLPTNASKRWPGKTLSEWIEIADASETDIPRLAPNSVSSYLTALVAMMSFALKEEWIDRNPASGLIEDDHALVKRRAFTPNELKLVFAHPDLQDEERRWFVRLLLYSGMRAGEVIQLRPTDVKTSGEITYLDLTEFDAATGRRDAAKSLKTPDSRRVVPLHRDLSGFAEWARGRKSDRLFTAWTAPGPRGNWTHYVSRWFAKVLDDVGLKGADTVMHSLRHGWSDAAERAGLLPRLKNSLGGWALQGQGDKYGRAALSVLSEAVDRIDFEGFRP